MRPAVRALVLLTLSFGLLLPGCRARQAPDEKPAMAAGDAKPFELNAETRAIDQRHIAVTLDMDIVAGTISGTCAITAAPVRDDTHDIVLHAADMTIDRVMINGRRAEFSYEDKALLRIHLDRGYDRAESLAIETRYSCAPKQGLYFFHPAPETPYVPLQVWSQGEATSNRAWIPCYDLPDDRVTHELLVTVPAGLQTISNGERVAITPAGDGRECHHWRMDAQHVTYLISFIAGTFDEVCHEEGGVRYGYFLAPGWREQAEFIYGRTPGMTRFFEDYTGQPYMWGKYDQTTVWDFIYGGMENTGATTLNMRALYDKRAQDVYSADYLIAHELAHMWFGDYLTCHTFDHMTQNEGFATYFTDLWVEQAHGRDEFLRARRENNDTYFRWATPEQLEKLALRTEVRVPCELKENAYQKGSAVLHMLRFVLGDTAFRDAVRLYVKTNANRGVTSEDWRLALETAHGKSLQWFFDEWYYSGIGYPVFDAAYDWDAAAGLVRLRVKQTQRIGGKYPLYRMPVDVEITTDGAASLHRVEITQADQTFDLSATAKPDMVIFDKGGWLLKKLRFRKPAAEWCHQLAHGDSLARTEAAQALPEFGAAGVAALMAAAAKDPYEETRRAAVASLDAIHRGPAVARLLQALDSPEHDISKAVTQRLEPGDTAALVRELTALRQRAPEPAMQTAFLQCLRDAHPKVRAAAASALAGCKSPDVEIALRATLRDDGNDYVRAAAGRSLAMLGVPHADPLLAEALRAPSYNNVIATRVVEGLMYAGDAGATEAIRGLADYQYGMGMRPALGQAALAATVALKPDAPETAVLLEQCIEHPAYGMRIAAAQWIEQRKQTGALPALEARLNVETRQPVKARLEAVIRALKEWQGETVEGAKK